jgi:hypothetical protein
MQLFGISISFLLYSIFISGAAGSRMTPVRLLSVLRARGVPSVGIPYAGLYGHRKIICIINNLKETTMKAVLNCLKIFGPVDRQRVVGCGILAGKSKQKDGA